MNNQSHSALVEKVARIIDPNSFKSHEGLYRHCLKFLDPEDEARKTADICHGPDLDKARSTAFAAIAAIYEALKEPTGDMSIAGKTAYVECMGETDEVWQAMLSASPIVQEE